MQHTDNTIWTTEPPGTAIIYCAFSTISTHDYVGQTTEFTTRNHREAYDATRLVIKKKSYSTKIHARQLEKTMARTDYKTWYHWPVRILGTHSTIEQRLQHEKQIIQWLKPTLNHTKRGKLKNYFLRPLRNTPTPLDNIQRCIHKKKRICKNCKATALSTPPTMFTTTTLCQTTPATIYTGPNLDQLLHN